ncbi:MAG TPA: hypothetical protein VFO31_00635 [Vicinamibacterales bacterium]|nr:hypothetical protein [Vicinamibacterales bacterium]
MAMSIYTVYRISIWLPIAIPAALLGMTQALRLPLADISMVLEILVGSLVIGGVPYFFLALWGTWWVGDRPEAEIRRMMFRAPLLMVALFASAALVGGLVFDSFMPSVAVALLGSVVILPLGYAYVALAVALRDWLGPREA